MAKRTLLSMTQNILAAMSSDLVNSIGDTEEASMVAEFIRETYEELMSQRDWPHLKDLNQLDAIGDSDMPTKFTIPSDVDLVEWFKYDKRDLVTDAASFETVVYKSPEDFLSIVQSRSTDTTNITGYTDPDMGTVFNIITDAPPCYWTSFDETTIICDSFDSALESTLQGSKTTIYATHNRAWLVEDSFIPDLPSKMFPLLLAEAKEVSMLNLRQVANQKEATRSRRQNNTMQHRSPRHSSNKGWTSYGRK